MGSHLGLFRWHEETRERGLKYADMIESSCGGPPFESALVDFPFTVVLRCFIGKRRSVADINTGMWMGTWEVFPWDTPSGRSIVSQTC